MIYETLCKECNWGRQVSDLILDLRRVPQHRDISKRGSARLREGGAERADRERTDFLGGRQVSEAIQKRGGSGMRAPRENQSDMVRVREGLWVACGFAFGALSCALTENAEPQPQESGQNHQHHQPV